MNKDRLKFHDFILAECFVISGAVRCEVASVTSFGNGELVSKSVESVFLDLNGFTLPELKALSTLNVSLGCVSSVVILISQAILRLVALAHCVHREVKNLHFLGLAVEILSGLKHQTDSVKRVSQLGTQDLSAFVVEQLEVEALLANEAVVKLEHNEVLVFPFVVVFKLTKN